MLNSNRVVKSDGRTLGMVRSKDLDQEVAESATGSAGDQVKCKLCGDQYERSTWDFHKLCPVHFAKFDQQKMAGRIGVLNHTRDVKSYFESSKEWVRSKQQTT